MARQALSGRDGLRPHSRPHCRPHPRGGKIVPILFRFPYPTGGHSDDACNWNADDLHSTEIIKAEGQQVLLKRTLDATTYYVAIQWEGKAAFKRLSRNAFRLTPQDRQFAFTCEYRTTAGTVANKDAESVFQASAAYWTSFWQTGGIVDFSRCSDARAKELERRVVLSQYLLAVNCAEIRLRKKLASPIIHGSASITWK